MKEGWELKKLCEVAVVAAGQGAPQGDGNYCSDGIPFIKAGNLESLINGMSEHEVQNVSDVVAKSHRLKLYKAGSVLFAKSGMSCMKGWVYTLKHDCYVVSHLAIITPHKQKIESRYLNYYFQFYKPNTLVKDAAYPSISLKDIENMPLLTPPLSEQQHIVEELDLLSSIIEKKKAQLKELDNLAQSLFYEMFGDPITNDKGWQIRLLKEVIKVVGGYAFKSSAFVEEGIPVLRIGNINSGEFKAVNMVFWEKDEKLSRYRMIAGDLVMSLTGTVGKSDYGNVCILDDSYKEYYLNQRNAKLEIVGDIDKWYLSNILKNDSVKTKLTDISRGVRQANISNKDIENLRIPIPPLALQQQFASKIEAIEHQKELIKKSIKDVETLFNCRMDYYFN